LTYTIWKERKAQALELQEADREFRKFKERQERSGKETKRFLGQEPKKKEQKKGFKAFFQGSAASQSATAGQRGEEDEERLVGGETASGSQIKPPVRGTTWGSEAPPAYSSVPVEDSEHD
jgi:hypothetical protein